MSNIPDNFTLKQARDILMHDDTMLHLAPRVKFGYHLRVRFVLKTIPEMEAPDTMSMGDFRALCESGDAFIAIDGEGGGFKTPAPKPKELV